MSKSKLSLISTLHYWKLFFRSCLLVAAATIYVYDWYNGLENPLMHLDFPPFILKAIWIIFIIEMILRFFPSNLESMGCQKQFKKNYIPTGREFKHTKNPRAPKYPTLLILASWIALNGAIFALYFAGILDEGFLLLISLAYSVCDMICILFFCPFQEWMMKNKCCGSCRIYNWDFAMMFTPLIVIKTTYTWSLLGVALLLLIVWEVLFRVYPERFYENTNASLACKNCPEKLCHHKKSLRRFLKNQSKYVKETVGGHWENSEIHEHIEQLKHHDK